MSETAREAAEAVASRLMAAWTAGDGAAFAAAFIPDGDFVNLIGMYMRGREAIARQHQAIFDGIYAGSTMSMAFEAVRQLRDDVVIAQAPVELAVPSGPVQGTIRGFVTLVLVREGGEWLIASFQNTRRDAGAPPDQAARIVAGAGPNR